MNNATKSNIPSKSKRNDQLFFVIPYESTYTLDVIKKTSQIILIANATDEMLRWVTSVIYFRRTATRDTQIRGQDIQKGDKVVMWYGSANRDEDVFEDGHLFQVDRPNAKKHLAFGAGEHLCLGNRLGHMQIRILF